MCQKKEREWYLFWQNLIDKKWRSDAFCLSKSSNKYVGKLCHKISKAWINVKSVILSTKWYRRRRKVNPNLFDKWYICYLWLISFCMCTRFNLHIFNTFSYYVLSNPHIIRQSVISMSIILTCSHLHSRSSTKVINISKRRNHLHKQIMSSIVRVDTKMSVSIYVRKKNEGECWVRYLARNICLALLISEYTLKMKSVIYFIFIYDSSISETCVMFFEILDFWLITCLACLSIEKNKRYRFIPIGIFNIPIIVSLVNIAHSARKMKFILILS